MLRRERDRTINVFAAMLGLVLVGGKRSHSSAELLAVGKLTNGSGRRAIECDRLSEKRKWTQTRFNTNLVQLSG